jgi:hypothetical protein
MSSTGNIFVARRASYLGTQGGTDHCASRHLDGRPHMNILDKKSQLDPKALKWCESTFT